MHTFNMTQLGERIDIQYCLWNLECHQSLSAETGLCRGAARGILFALTYFSIHATATSTAIALKQRACFKQ